MQPALLCGIAHKRLMVSRNLVRQELERHEAVQACIFGLVHHAHATTTEFLDDAVVGNRAAEDG